MYLQPFKHKLLSLTRLAHRTLQDASCRVWELSPAQKTSIPPAIFDPADLQHVTGAQELSTVPLEIESLLTPVQRHAASKAFLLKGVDVIDGYLYGARWKDKLIRRSAPIFARAPQTRLAHGALACTWAGNSYFGHWLHDDVPLHLAAAQFGDPFIIDRQPYLHELRYRDLLNVPRTAIRRARFDELVVFEDYALNAFKRERYEILRARLAPQVRKHTERRIFLRRGPLGNARTITNAAEMESFLHSHGFHMMEPEEHDPLDIASRLSGADLVLGVEGSQMSHALMSMRPGAVLCCIQPPWRFCNIFRGNAECIGIRYATVVGRSEQRGFRVDLDGLQKMLDRAETALARAAA